jgi:hypothetical protein
VNRLRLPFNSVFQVEYTKALSSSPPLSERSGESHEKVTTATTASKEKKTQEKKRTRNTSYSGHISRVYSLQTDAVGKQRSSFAERSASV